MDCEAFHKELLSADPEALASGGAEALTQHMRSCPDCTAAALAIVAATRRLALDLTPATTLAVHQPRTLRNRPVLVRTAIAAGFMGAMLIGPRAFEHGSTRIDPVSAPTSVPTFPAVTVPPGQNAVVFQTSDPRITVVWYY
jgi:hypothetical protein